MICKIETIEVIEDKQNRRKRRFAFVSFGDHDTVNEIVSHKYYTVNGHNCKVKEILLKQK